MATIINSGVSGLRANQQMLDVVGNNLANTNTTGFKSQTVQFSDLVYQTFQQATGGSSANIGSTNPKQVGSGVQVAAINANLQQGTLETTGNDMDMALEGRGYFVVNDGVQNLYTRAGAFNVDAQNFLVDPATGARVQRFGTVGEGSATTPAFQTVGNNAIKIPFGMQIPGKATTTVTIQGNLPASAVGPLAQTVTSVAPLTAGGTAATGGTFLNALDDNTAPYGGTDTIHIQGTTSAGTTVDTTFAVGAATTVTNLLSAITAAFAGSTATIDASGNIVVQDAATGPSKLAVTLSDSTGNTGGTAWSNHGLTVTATGKDGDTATSGVQFFDLQGTAHTMTLVFQKVSSNTWNMTGSVPAADGTLIDSTVTGIVFNDDGSFRQVTGTGAGDASMTIAIPSLTAPQTMTFNFGSPNSFDGLTQIGAATSAAASFQDGFSAGFLNNVSIGKDGIINGVFTNGRVLELAQLAVANFANPAALSREGNNYFALTSESGPALIGSGNTGGRGSVQQKQLEDSNVDVALEFTRLIIAQRGYQVNARAITTANEVLQELANIIR